VQNCFTRGAAKYALPFDFVPALCEFHVTIPIFLASNKTTFVVPFRAVEFAETAMNQTKHMTNPVEIQQVPHENQTIWRRPSPLSPRKAVAHFSIIFVAIWIDQRPTSLHAVTHGSMLRSVQCWTTQGPIACFTRIMRKLALFVQKYQVQSKYHLYRNPQ
jgi:hypothetical protein